MRRRRIATMLKKALPYLRNKYFWLVAVPGLLAPLFGQADERDPWQQRDLGTFSDEFTATVPAHGAVLVKIGKTKFASP
jgi:hypothetical protein